MTENYSLKTRFNPELIQFAVEAIANDFTDRNVAENWVLVQIANLSDTFLQCASEEDIVAEFEERLDREKAAIDSGFEPDSRKASSCIKPGRPLGYSPTHGEGGAMKQTQIKTSLPQSDLDWLNSQPNKSETVRRAIALYRKHSENKGLSNAY
jgi:hypothetical protein